AAVIDLSGVADLRVLRREDGAGLRVGASVAAREIELDPYTRSTYPALAESGALVGSVQIRNLATVGGNLCNAAPSADMAPTLLRATAAERALEGQPLTAQQIARAAQLAVEAARPISDQRGSADFRRHLVGVLTRRTLTTALERAGR